MDRSNESNHVYDTYSNSPCMVGGKGRQRSLSINLCVGESLLEKSKKNTPLSLVSESQMVSLRGWASLSPSSLSVIVVTVLLPLTRIYSVRILSIMEELVKLPSLPT